MDITPLTKRRTTSTLIIALLPLLLGIGLYLVWLNGYLNNYQVNSLDGVIPVLGFWLLVLAVPANILGLVFLYIPYSKNRGVVATNPSLKRKFLFLLSLLLLNYVVAAGIIYNYKWLSSTISVEFTNNYDAPLRDIIIVLPTGDALHMLPVTSGKKGHARVFSKGEGPVEFIVENREDQKVRTTIIGYVTSNMGGRVKVLLTPEFELEVFPDISSKEP